jgi:predicted nuclease with TOPRIM domain
MTDEIASIKVQKADKAETEALRVENAQLKANDKAKDQKIKELEQRLERIEKSCSNRNKRTFHRAFSGGLTLLWP